MEIAVSYLKRKETLETTIQKINATTAEYLHMDLLDGIFVSEKNLDFEELKKVARLSTKPLDIHLMVKDPLAILEFLFSLKPSCITIHIESQKVAECLSQIHAQNIKAGLSLNPNTKIETLIPYLEKVDVILLLSVYPGAGGQAFLPESKKRLKELKNYQTTYPFRLHIDGGINEETIKEVREDVDLAVSGSFICMSDHYEEQIQKLRE